MEDQARTFSPWSHVVSLLYAQLTHSLGLNDVCDALRLHSGSLSALRGATPPPKNTLSHANRRRDPKMAEQLFWSVLEHLQTLQPAFGGNRRPRFAFRFKRLIHVVDTTTIQLMARSLDWAKHRRRKAAAKCHVRLDLQTFLPRCAIVDTAGEHDNRRAREICANVQAGEIVIFDKAYLDFGHLADLAMREVFWVTRAKDNLQGRVVRKLQAGADANILRDDLMELTTPPVQTIYPVPLRRVTALVEVDGERREMIFLTNNVTWSAQTIADLYRCRWSIEVFFKELKQTLQLADFPGHNAYAVKWQVWTALLAYVLLRFCAFLLCKLQIVFDALVQLPFGEKSNSRACGIRSTMISRAKFTPAQKSSGGGAPLATPAHRGTLATGCLTPPLVPSLEHRLPHAQHAR